MGYHMDQMGAKFRMAAGTLPYAFAAIRALHLGPKPGTVKDSTGYHYRWVDGETALKAKDLTEILDEWRWHITFNTLTGDCVGITFTGEKYGDEDVLFAAIAPYVDAGSYIEMEGEDGAQWRWVFDGTNFRETSPTVSWP